jgi:hypothetical protein
LLHCFNCISNASNHAYPQDAKRSEERWKREARAQRQAAESVNAQDARRRMKALQVTPCSGLSMRYLLPQQRSGPLFALLVGNPLFGF